MLLAMSPFSELYPFTSVEERRRKHVGVVTEPTLPLRLAGSLSVQRPYLAKSGISGAPTVVYYEGDGSVLTPKRGIAGKPPTIAGMCPTPSYVSLLTTLKHQISSGNIWIVQQHPLT